MENNKKNPFSSSRNKILPVIAGSKQDIFFLWRPCLPDPSDDLVLEVSVAGDCDAIVTCNKNYFREAKRFGLNVYGPKEFLSISLLRQQQLKR
ncbi:MAG: PIN domain-containing protein [Thermodesulfobacteriota bacterium]|nr:PIN domain-containing protein [Thermodesulfobacteriota bacterium]